ncbi:hypothetical protein OROGR_030533 [Orobanche gracilis]
MFSQDSLSRRSWFNQHQSSLSSSCRSAHPVADHRIHPKSHDLDEPKSEKPDPIFTHQMV